ncbi:hypothetical protein [Rhizobium sp. 18065]|uniref:hypothetical protein n=1 Tax=Rhizobium sp. 18065 TaxID=2681411 RepID=UPI0013591781|nr:hypothetical protein [Rhizobium sp. 18065]
MGNNDEIQHPDQDQQQTAVAATIEDRATDPSGKELVRINDAWFPADVVEPA